MNHNIAFTTFPSRMVFEVGQDHVDMAREIENGASTQINDHDHLDTNINLEEKLKNGTVEELDQLKIKMAEKAKAMKRLNDLFTPDSEPLDRHLDTNAVLEKNLKDKTMSFYDRMKISERRYSFDDKINANKALLFADFRLVLEDHLPPKKEMETYYKRYDHANKVKNKYMDFFQKDGYFYTIAPNPDVFYVRPVKDARGKPTVPNRDADVFHMQYGSFSGILPEDDIDYMLKARGGYREGTRVISDVIERQKELTRHIHTIVKHIEETEK